jgi:hypothetical protein
MTSKSESLPELDELFRAAEAHPDYAVGDLQEIL